MISRFALVFAESAHLVPVLSAPGRLQVCVGHWGRSQAHELTKGFREGPQPVLHAGQKAVVPWRTQTGRVNRRGIPESHANSRAAWISANLKNQRLFHA